VENNATNTLTYETTRKIKGEVLPIYVNFYRYDKDTEPTPLHELDALDFDNMDAIHDHKRYWANLEGGGYRVEFMMYLAEGDENKRPFSTTKYENFAGPVLQEALRHLRGGGS